MDIVEIGGTQGSLSHLTAKLDEKSIGVCTGLYNH